ncbi:MAG: flippase-like domain-containing protein [Rhodobacterales bacterium]|nr:flippase-like domain-containing protein [Rhodobacterales bacterium]
MPRLLRLIGVLVVIGFGGYALWKGGRDLPILPVGQPLFWGWLGLGLALYLVSQALAARAWSGTLSVFKVLLPPGRAETQLLVSQIGKYIPGNVAHLLGRLALARMDGVSSAVAGLAMLLEVGLVLTAGGLLFLAFLLFAPGLTLSLLPPGLAGSLASLSLPLAAALAAGIGMGLWYLVRLIRRKSALAQLDPARAAKPLALHVVNFLALGLSLGCVTQAIAPTGNGTFLLSIPVFVVAWTVGFLMPGAPGGIGVREGLVVLGLGTSLGAGPALTAALLHRAICILGDLSIFALGYRRRQKQTAQISNGPPQG